MYSPAVELIWLATQLDVEKFDSRNTETTESETEV